MVEIRQIRGSALRKESETDIESEQADRPYSGLDNRRYCAYDQTRERFLSNEVEVANISKAMLEARLSALTSSSGVALWIVPLRGLSSTSFRLPVDLVYLNENYLVIDAVESFPISLVSSPIPPAASVLALPIRTIASVGIQPGDQLILCSPEEMEQRLKELQEPKAETQRSPHLADGQSTASPADRPIQGSSGSIPQWEDRIQLETFDENPSAGGPSPAPSAPQEPDSAPDPAQSVSPAQPESKYPSLPKNWWQRFLAGEPPEPRKAQRQPLPGLVAYFFTGGPAVAHQIRNMSATGLYVFTQERWYLGTILRMTLTDQREQTVERSITVYAQAVRWGSDGVGLHFILRRKKDPIPVEADLSGLPTKEQVNEFLRHYRTKL